MSRRNKDRIYIKDLDKALVVELQAKLQQELFVGLKEKYELIPTGYAKGNSIGSLTFSYYTPKRKHFVINVRHVEKASFEINMTCDVHYRARVEFAEIRNHFHSLIEFLKKI